MKINERILNKKDIDDEVIKVNKNKVNYIYTANNMISDNICQEIIKYIEEFKSNKFGKEGTTLGKNLNKDMKNSYDIYMDSGFVESQDKNFRRIFTGLYHAIFSYTHYYLCHTGNYGTKNIGLSYDNWKNSRPIYYSKSIVWEDLCFRKYNANEGAYFKPHFDKPIGNNRILAGIIYLNKLNKGGSIVFPQYNKKIKPDAGKLVMFPSNFTHLHYTEPSDTDRYCVVIHVRELRNEMEPNAPVLTIKE